MLDEKGTNKVTGMIFDDGSVIDFKPVEAFKVESWRGLSHEDPPVKGMDGLKPIYDLVQEMAYGWATVVTHRESWVVETEIQPMVVCCGGLRPLTTHSNSDHRSKGEDFYWWRMAG